MRELSDNLCEGCGFDASTWAESAKVEAIMQARRRAEAALGDVNPATLNTRPTPTTWSALEYVEHIREVLLHNRLVCESALRVDGRHYEGSFPPALDERPANLDPDSVLKALDDEACRNAALFGSLSGSDWERFAVLLDSKWTLRPWLV